MSILVRLLLGIVLAALILKAIPLVASVIAGFIGLTTTLVALVLKLILLGALVIASLWLWKRVKAA